jgi:lipoprotein NlpD
MNAPWQRLLLLCAVLLLASCAATRPAPISSRSDQISAPEVKPSASSMKPVMIPVRPNATASGSVAPTAAEEAINWAWPVTHPHPTLFSVSGKGVEISGGNGEPVHAAASGVVTYVGDSLKSYGQMVVIKHGPNYLSVYANNNKILVKEGQEVTRGEKIAELGSGDTGLLHFEIRHLGKPVDPLTVMPALKP